jgi:hypothetical protein
MRVGVRVQVPGAKLVLFLAQCVGEQLIVPLLAIVAAKADEVRSKAAVLRRLLQEARSLARQTTDMVLPWMHVKTLIVELCKTNAEFAASCSQFVSSAVHALPDAMHGLYTGAAM